MTPRKPEIQFKCGGCGLLFTNAKAHANHKAQCKGQLVGVIQGPGVKS